MVVKSMINKKILLLVLIILVLQISCKKPDEPAKSDIVINELLPVNTSIVPDQDGEYDDWIELYNISRF